MKADPRIMRGKITQGMVDEALRQRQESPAVKAMNHVYDRLIDNFSTNVDWSEEIDNVAGPRRRAFVDSNTREFLKEKGHIHTTRENKDIPIYRMEDTHLINTVKLASRKIRTSYNEVVGGASMLDDIMGGGSARRVKAEDLKAVISEAYIFIGRFVMEGCRRGLGKDMEIALVPFRDVMEALDSYTSTPKVALPSRIENKELDDIDLDLDIEEA